MPSITFEVPGIPVGKGRARHATRKRKGGGTYIATITPDKTVNYEAQLKKFAADAMEAAGLSPMEGPLRVRVLAVFPKPPSWSREKAEATEWHTIKPDSDNILKCLDGLNAIAWRDDSQIADVGILKRYSDDGSARLRVSVETIT